MRNIVLLLIALALLLAVACDDNGESDADATATAPAGATQAPADGGGSTDPSDGAATDTPEALEATPTDASSLKPPDSETPIDGICAEPVSGQEVTITFLEDVPDPRCIQVNVPQVLRIANERPEAVRVVFGPFDVTIEPGASQLLDGPVGTYLAAGVHEMGPVEIPGYRASIWVLDVATP
ncbi:MAG: hypothetical protein WEE64_15010 [Dehalococcoidia bacterium]